MLTLVAALALLHVAPQAEDAPVEHPVVALPPPVLSNDAYRAQLKAELKREEDNRPSAAGFAGGGALIGLGAVATVFGLGSGGAFGSISFSGYEWGFNPITTGGYVAIGLGIASMIAGTVWMIALGVSRSGPGERIRALEARIAANEERENQKVEAEAEARLTPAARELKATRPGFGLPVGLILGGASAIALGAYLGYEFLVPPLSYGYYDTPGNPAFLAGAITCVVIGLVAAGLGIAQAVTRHREALEIDRQLDAMPPAQPPAPPTPAGSLLPPAPVLVGFSWPI